MKLAVWMAEKQMEGTELAKILGISRSTVWKMKIGKPVDPKTADKVYFLTGGKVKPLAWPVGIKKGSAVDCEQHPQ